MRPEMKLDIPQRAPPPDHRPLGAELRRLRGNYGLALREVARRMGVSAPYLSDLERGNRLWTEETRDKFLKALKGR